MINHNHSLTALCILVPLLLAPHLILTTYGFSQQSNSSTSSKDTDTNQNSPVVRVEYINGTKITYFENGSRQFEVVLTLTITTTWTTTNTLATTSVILVPTFMLDLQTIYLVVKIASAFATIIGFLATVKWYFKHRKRPPIYVGIPLPPLKDD